MSETVRGRWQRAFIPIVGLAALVGLYLTSRHNYLLFHALAEIFSIVVAYGIFMIAWNSRQYIENDYLIVIAIAYLFIGGLDLLHTLSYKGMTIFPDYDYYANQLWIATRYMESLTLLAGCAYFYRAGRADPYLIFGAYTGVSTLIVLSIFTWKIFPVCFVEGVGQTLFKKISEYVICGILVIDIGLLRKHRQRFEPTVFTALLWSLIFTIISELAFTVYIDNYDLSNLIGHYFKIFSFYLIYKAIIETGMTKPYDIIFRELVQKEQRLAEAKKTAEDAQQAAEDAQQAAEDAQQAAEFANQAKSEFLSSMSHELRTPLNGILGYAQILKRDRTLGGPQQDGLAIIERSGQHLLNLINEVLDFSKIEARKMEIHPAPFELPEFSKNLSEIIEIRTHQKGLRFRTELAPDLPALIVADEQRLRQVLLNLLGNAVKFTEQGGVTLRILDLGFEIVDCGELPTAASNQKSQIKKLKFEILDTGIGIPPDRLQDIFEPFQQVGAPRFHCEGTGLGLAISQRLLRLMGSELCVASVPEQGSRFWFELRCPTPTESAAVTRPTSVTPHEPIGYEGTARTILVADAHPESRAIVSGLLRILGFRILEARQWQDVTDIIHTRHPDAVMLDFAMMARDHGDGMRQLKASPHWRDIVWIALSANAFEQARQYSLEVGCQEFLTKPLSFQALIESLGRSLRLEWRYAADSPENPDEREPAAFVFPPMRELEHFYAAAEIGDVQDILDQLGELESRDPAWQPFLAAIRQLTRTFRLDQLRDLINEAITTARQR